MMQSLIRRLNAPHLRSKHLDADRCRVRCLAHILHLAAMQLMIELKAMKKPDTATDATAVDLAGDLSTEEAEKLEADYDENDIGVDDGSVTTTVMKVSDQSHVGSCHPHFLLQIRAVSKYIRNGAARRDAWTAAIGAFNERSTESSKLTMKIPILDVPTRWNSTFLMFERAYEYREVCQV